MTYKEMRKKHQDFFNEFSKKHIICAFTDERLMEQLEEKNLKLEDICSAGVAGVFVPKDKVDDYLAVHKKIRDEEREAMKDDEFAVSAFVYEMFNHEYCINYQGDYDVLGCLGYKEEDLAKDERLNRVYNKARKQYFRECGEF